MKNINQINEIRKQLAKQPFEDVYSYHFSRKEMNDELYDVFLKSLDTSKLDSSEINSRKINLLKDWVKNLHDNGLDSNKFPSFVDFYIKQFYRDDGLRYLRHEGSILVLEKELEKNDNFEQHVEKFEWQLISKNWWSEQDVEVWMDLQRKRIIVKDFEDYIHDLEIELIETWFKDNETVIDDCQKIYNEHIHQIEIEIAKIKLFKGNLLKIPMLENLIKYISLLRDDEKHHHDLLEKSFTKEENLEFDFPINLEDQEKFVYCSKLGVIEFLKTKIEDSGVKLTDVKLYPLIMHITGNSLASVKKLMSFHNTPINASKDNPFTDSKLMERVNKFLINNGLVKTGD